MRLLNLCLVLVVFALQGVDYAYAGNYLFYLPFASKSIKLGFMPMAKELAKRGHKVTIISPFKEKKAIVNIEEINNESGFTAITEKFSNDVLAKGAGDISNLPIKIMFEETLDSNRNALSMPEVKKILFDASVKVDVVMTIPVLGNEIGNWVAHKKNASMVHFLSVPFLMPWVAAASANPINPSYMPSPFFPFSQYMSFQERVMNTIGTTALLVIRQLIALPRIAAVITSVFPDEDVSEFSSMCDNSALTINMGSPFTGDGLRPIMPNVIKAGLMSCVPGSGLEGELKAWVDGAEHGVIYMSFGSVVKGSQMSEERRKLFLSALSKLKERVVWKWEKEMLDVPANVKTFAWLPQTDLLAHPNVKLFITHGGAGSIQETICHKTPIVGIPIMGDQMNNLAEALTHHLGVVLPWVEVTEEKFLQNIKTVLDDSSYQESVASLQNLILDAPMHPLDHAVWWLEYLLRHPHNPRMRSPAKELYWFQYYLLDVAGLVFLVLYIVYKILRTVFGLLCGLCCSRKSKQKTA
eukprot:TRINITY_DN10124_c0_g1_i3.p1 TRINITY_DN10124_c0_g1~~TRINITY_DN10124_c0_g1_i3.p1  ORF type:complete len:524 (-),score=91.72 TRINITY_DN10124_c0_g1_i3:413-1984(-)